MSDDHWIPIYANKSLDTPHPTITRAIIAIHGSGRDGEAHCIYLEEAARGHLRQTIIIAPSFVTREDHPAPDSLYWPGSGWKAGGPDAHRRMSSFSVVDWIIGQLADQRNFPSLRAIVVAGHSAGGQFVNRYAAGSPTEDLHPHLAFRYLIANPSSYLYLSPHRWDGGRFARPRGGNGYNRYRYGLDDLNEYLLLTGEDRIREQYHRRRVAYLLGEKDTGAPDSLDQNEGAMLQGRHRLERGENYYRHLGHVYGDSIYSRHTKHVIPRVGHSALGIYRSREGRAFLFGEDDRER